MNKINPIVTFLICVLSFPLYGQESNDTNFSAKNEISIVIDDIFAKNSFVFYPLVYSQNSTLFMPYYIDYSSIDMNTPKIGLGYKYHLAKSAIRSKVSFGLRNYLSDDKNNKQKNDNSYLTLNAFLGYEFHKNFVKTQLFYGLDVFVNYNKINSKNTNYFNPQNISSESVYSYKGFGVSPLIGAKYFFNPMISISTELKFIIESFSGESVYKNSENTEDDKTKLSGLNTKVGPLGQISINIHF